MIRLHGVGKNFGRTAALSNIDLELAPGVLSAVIGPNGAGKTTLFRIIAGIYRPSRGTVTVQDADPFLGHAQAIGITGESLGLWPALSAGEHLRIWQRLSRGSSTRVAEASAGLELTGFLRKPVRNMSRGQRKRLALARAFIIPAQLLLLDEPTSGLDPTQLINFRELLRERHGEGVTILLNSHDLSEIEQVATQLLFMKDGELIRQTDRESLPTGDIWTLTLRENLQPDALARLRAVPGVKHAQLHGTTTLELHTDEAATTYRIAAELGAQHVSSGRTVEVLYQDAIGTAGE